MMYRFFVWTNFDSFLTDLRSKTDAVVEKSIVGLPEEVSRGTAKNFIDFVPLC